MGKEDGFDRLKCLGNCESCTLECSTADVPETSDNDDFVGYDGDE